MDTRSAPELPAIKASRRYLYLGAGLITAIIACVVIALVWVYVQAATQATAIADRQGAKRSELAQARVRWQARSFDNYRLHIQFAPYANGFLDSPYCEKVFEVHEPGQTKTLSDTCAGRYEFVLRYVGVGGSVSGLFNYIDHEISHVGDCVAGSCECHGASTIDVVYDTNYGYPKSVEHRFETWWPMKKWHRACTAVFVSPPGPFKVAVNPIQ